MKYILIELNCLKNIMDKQSEFPIESSETLLYFDISYSFDIA